VPQTAPPKFAAAIMSEYFILGIKVKKPICSRLFGLQTYVKTGPSLFETSFIYRRSPLLRFCSVDDQ
jgi:hypothetical protein